MTRKRQYVDHLRDIVYAAEEGGRFVAGISFYQFESDE